MSGPLGRVDTLYLDHMEQRREREEGEGKARAARNRLFGDEKAMPEPTPEASPADISSTENKARDTLRSMPEEPRKLLLKYATPATKLFKAVSAGQWDVVAKMASHPLPVPQEEAVRQQLHSWLTDYLST